MKMKIFALILVAAISLLALAACNGDSSGKEECDHPRSAEWSSDANSHWHAVTCEHGEYNRDNMESHADANEDGKCDACGYEVGHTHSFTGEWLKDEFEHWKTATCSHDGEIGEKGLHSDDDINFLCDKCGYHVHNLNGLGYCKDTACGKLVKPVDENDFVSLAGAFLHQSYFINGVTINKTVDVPSLNEDFENGRSSTGWDTYVSHVEEAVSVLFGVNGYVHTVTETHNTKGTIDADGNKSKGYLESVGKVETWHEKDRSGAFGISVETAGTDEPITNFDSVADKLNGVYLALSVIANGYGTENFVYSVAELLASDGVSDLVANYNPDENKANIKFNLLSVSELLGTNMNTGEKEVVYNAYYYEIEINFSYTDDFVLTHFDVNCDCYSNNAGQLFGGAPNLLDVNIRYNVDDGTFDFVAYDPGSADADKNGYKVVDKSETHHANYYFVIDQTIGERTAENEKPKSMFMPESFDIFLAESYDYDKAETDKNYTPVIKQLQNGDTITFDVNTIRYVQLGNFLPEGTSLEFVNDLITYNILDANGNVMNNTDWQNLPTYDEDDPEYDPINPEKTVPLSNDFRSSYTFDTEYDESGNRTDIRKIMLVPKTAGNYTLVINYNGVETYRVNIVAE